MGAQAEINRCWLLLWHTMSQLSARFSASVLKNAKSEGKIPYFPMSFDPRIHSAVVPNRLVDEGAAVKDLHRDLKYSGWCGTTGKEVTYVMIKHAQPRDFRVNVQSASDAVKILNSLEWLSGKHARVAQRVTFPLVTALSMRITGRSSWIALLSAFTLAFALLCHYITLGGLICFISLCCIGFQCVKDRQLCVIPHGYMVSLPSLEQCVGRTLKRGKDGVCDNTVDNNEFRPLQLQFYLPEFDICPSAHTQFLKGDRVYFGCRDESFRFIIIDDKDDLEVLRKSLNGEMKVSKKITVTCTKEAVPMQGGPEELMTLLEGFEFQGHLKGAACDWTLCFAVGQDTA